jgi:molybdate transport system substrate-binding protein
MSTRETNDSGGTIKLLTSNSMHGVLDELLPQFERASGTHVSVSYDPALVMLERIAAGESGDLAILSQPAIDAVTEQGKIAPESRRTLARCAVGIAVRSGAPKPDISSVEAFKRALMDARSIAHTTSGASGIHFSSVVQKLGIAAEVSAKAVKNQGGLIGTLVAKGEAELAVQQIPELMAVPGIDLVGPLPQELQSISTVTVGIFNTSQAKNSAQALIDFLSQPSSGRVFKTKGLEPV